ncbi:chalcone isomerase family protein [Halobacteriovorax sp. GFR7]|uniref:chalcone isomerase family protein n=1 Tax=unclassified Halobacteriovorax TaxID=2639665 RepID=UPI00371EC742
MIKLMRNIILLGLLSLYANASSDQLRLIGKGTLSYFIWDVYEVSYFKNSSDKVELLKIRYLRDIEKKLSQKGWQEALKHYDNIESQLKAFVESSVDVKEGDIISIYKLNGDKVVIKKNDKVILERRDDKKLYSLAHAPWIGEYPVDSDLKRDLLK